jgi:transcriptional regulator GlxA family with amidase domain
MGLSLQKFYRTMRLRYGMWLLQNTSRTITDIGQDCGFSDTAHFSRGFRAVFKKTPTDYR